MNLADQTGGNMYKASPGVYNPAAGFVGGPPAPPKPPKPAAPLGPAGSVVMNPPTPNVNRNGDFAGLPDVSPPAQFPQQGSLDPNVLLQQMLEHLVIGKLNAATKAASEQALIGFGDPALASQYGVDPSFARNNPFSTLAQLGKANDLARRGINNNLAGRGLINSGDLGYLQGQQANQYGQAQYDARSKLLSYLSDLKQQEQDRREALKQSVLNAVLSAYQQFGQAPQIDMSLFGG